MKRSLQSSDAESGPIFLVSGVALIATTYGLARLGFGLFLPVFASSFALTPATSGMLSSGSSLLYCVASGLGLLWAGSRPRTVAVLAGLTATIGSLGIAAAHSTAVFAIAVLLAGMGAGFATPALVELVPHNAQPSRERRAQSTVNSGTGFGVVLAGILSLVLGDAWRVAWILVAVIAVVSTVGVLCGDSGPQRSVQERATGRIQERTAGRIQERTAGRIQERTAGRTPERAAGRMPERAAGRMQTREWVQVRGGVTLGSGVRTLGSGLRTLAKPLAGAVLLGGGSAAVWVYGRTVLEDVGGMSPAASAGAWIALGIGGGAAVLLSRWLAARPIALTWPLTCLGTAGATALVGVLPTVTVAAIAGALLFGLTYTAASSVLILWATTTSGNGAAGTSALFIALVLGQAGGAFLTGILLGITTPGAAFALAAAMCGAAAAAALGVRTPTTGGPARPPVGP